MNPAPASRFSCRQAETEEPIFMLFSAAIKPPPALLHPSRTGRIEIGMAWAYRHGLLRIEVPFKDPMEDAVKVDIKAIGPDTIAKITEAV